MISYLSFLKVIKLPIIDMTLFWCFVLSFYYISKFYRWLSWKRFIQPLNFLFHALYRHLCAVFTTTHFQWIKNIPFANKLSICTHYADATCVLIFLLYILYYLFTQPSLDSSSPYTAHLLILICFQSLHIAEADPWIDIDHLEVLAIFLSQKASWFDLTIAAAVPIVLVIFWHCEKSTQTVHENMKCSIMGSIQRLK